MSGGCSQWQGRPLEVGALRWDRHQFDLLPTPQEVGGLDMASGRGPCGRPRAPGTAGGGGRRLAQTLLLPFYGLTVSEAALTRTSAIRLPPGLGPETRGGGGGGAGATGEESPGGRREGRGPGSRKMSPLQGIPL